MPRSKSYRQPDSGEQYSVHWQSVRKHTHRDVLRRGGRGPFVFGLTTCGATNPATLICRTWNLAARTWRRPGPTCGACRHYENFSLFLLSPRRLRPALRSIYAFARFSDDLADEAPIRCRGSSERAAPAAPAALAGLLNVLPESADRHPVLWALAEDAGGTRCHWRNAGACSWPSCRTRALPITPMMRPCWTIAATARPLSAACCWH